MRSNVNRQEEPWRFLINEASLGQPSEAFAFSPLFPGLCGAHAVVKQNLQLSQWRMGTGCHPRGGEWAPSVSGFENGEWAESAESG
jgi:hypothetical protein